MPVALAKAHDLVLDGRAIARAAALDLPRIHGRAVHVGANDVVRRRRGPRDATLNLRVGDMVGQRRKWLGRLVPRLQLQRRPVDRAAIQPWRRASLEAPEREPGTLEGARKPKRRRLPNPAGWNLPFPDMNEPAQKC